MFERKLSNNLRYYTWYYTLSGFIFTIPIWVAFFTRTITLEQLAIITGIENLIMIILEVPTGALADLLGRRLNIMIGLGLRTIWAMSLPFMSDFSSILMIVIVGAIGETMISGAEGAILYDSLKEDNKEEQFGKIYVKIGFNYRLGLIISSFVSGWMFTYWYGTPYFFRGLASILALASISLMVEPKIDSEKFSWKTYINQTKEGIAELTQSPFVKKLTIYYLLVAGITWTCLIWFNQPFAYDFGWEAQSMSYITAGAYLASTLILYGLTRKEGLLTRKRVYLGFPLLMIVALTPGIVVGKYVAIVLLILSQLAGSGRFAILDKYINKEFSSKNRATSLSTLNMGVSLLVAILIFGGGIIQGILDTRAVFTVLGILTFVIIFPLSLSLISDHKKYKSMQNKVSTT